MVETQSGKGIHYAWWILVSCCFLYAGSFALINSIIGVYMLPVSTELDVQRGDFSFLLTIQGFVIVVALPLWGNIVQKININACFTFAALCMILGVLGFSFSSELWQFYVFGGLTGIGVSAIFTLATPFLIGNWFAKKHRGKMLGIATAFSGVSTIFWSPLFTIIIQNFGWQTSYQINALLMAVLILPWTLFVIKRSPEEKGLKPYGYVEGATGETAAEDDLQKGISAKGALKAPAFWLIFLAVAIVAIGAGFSNNQPGIAREFLGDAMSPEEAALIGASMISAAALGNLLSKVGFGFVADRLKLQTTFLIFLAIWMLAFVFWLAFGSIAPMLIAGGFCLGFSNAPSRVGFPLAARQLFGNRDFSKIWSYTAVASSIVGGFSTSIIAWVFDLSGSYVGALVFGIVLLVIVAILVSVALSFVGKIKWDDAQPPSTTVVDSAKE